MFEDPLARLGWRAELQDQIPDDPPSPTSPTIREFHRGIYKEMRARKRDRERREGR